MKKQTTLLGRVWSDLSGVNVNDHVEKRGKFSYLSWTWAWSTLKQSYPETYISFKNVRHNNGSMTVECFINIHEGEEVCSGYGWLPVMDHLNKAIIDPDSRAISDARMRCLVKTIAMTTGLGLYIYSGESMPQAEKPEKGAVITEAQAKELFDLFKSTGADVIAWANHYGVQDISELPAEKYEQVYNALRGDMETAERSAAQAETVDEFAL